VWWIHGGGVGDGGGGAKSADIHAMMVGGAGRHRCGLCAAYSRDGIDVGYWIGDNDYMPVTAMAG